jgi:hypothetical protein
MIAITFDAQADVGGIRGRDIGLGHTKGRTDLTLEQRP